MGVCISITDLKFPILLSFPPKFWDYRPWLSHPIFVHYLDSPFKAYSICASNSCEQFCWLPPADELFYKWAISRLCVFAGFPICYVIECKDWSRTGSSRVCFPGLQSVLFVGFFLSADHVSIHCTIWKKRVRQIMILMQP